MKYFTTIVLTLNCIVYFVEVVEVVEIDVEVDVEVDKSSGHKGTVGGPEEPLVHVLPNQNQPQSYEVQSFRYRFNRPR